MIYLLEHKSVGAALDSLRRDAIGESKGAEDVRRVVVVGWSSREILLLRPEFSCLARPDVTYIRLPSDEADARLSQSVRAHTPTEAEADGELPPPGEQWEWALSQLQADLEEGARGRANERLAELGRFAAAKWPGWYDGALRALKRSVEEGNRCDDLIESCRTHSPVVESFDAAAPLLRWGSAERGTQAVELVREVSSYALQGALDLESCRQAISDEAAWRELVQCCEDTRTALTKLREAGRPLDERIQAGVDEVCDGVGGLMNSISEGGGDVERSAREWSSDVDRITSALQHLSDLRDSVRARLHPRAEGGS